MPQKKYTILLAEDDTFLQRMYSTKFIKEGFAVLSATDGEQAIALLKKQTPDVVVLDIIMPKKDGFAVLDVLKSDPAFRDIPVVLLTNLSELEDIKRARRMGVHDYLIKAHFLPSEVVEHVKKRLIKTR